MLKSFLLNRPYVIFDPANKEHRLIYNKFLKTGSWSNCSYQFICEAPYLDLPSCINYKLVNYFFSKEFAKKTEISRSSRKIKVAQN